MNYFKELKETIYKLNEILNNRQYEKEWISADYKISENMRNIEEEWNRVLYNVLTSAKTVDDQCEVMGQ